MSAALIALAEALAIAVVFGGMLYALLIWIATRNIL